MNQLRNTVKESFLVNVPRTDPIAVLNAIHVAYVPEQEQLATMIFKQFAELRIAQGETATDFIVNKFEPLLRQAKVIPGFQLSDD